MKNHQGSVDLVFLFAMSSNWLYQDKLVVGPFLSLQAIPGLSWPWDLFEVLRDHGSWAKPWFGLLTVLASCYIKYIWTDKGRSTLLMVDTDRSLLIYLCVYICTTVQWRLIWFISDTSQGQSKGTGSFKSTLWEDYPRLYIPGSILEHTVSTVHAICSRLIEMKHKSEHMRILINPASVGIGNLHWG